MSLRAAGVAFCAIAAFLFTSWYVVAAIGGAGPSQITRLAQFLGAILMPIGSMLALLVGLPHLSNAALKDRAEFQESRRYSPSERE